MGIEALGYIGVRAKDWMTGGPTGAISWPATHRQEPLDARLPHGDRKQRLVVDADGGQGIGFFGWEVRTRLRWTLAARIEAAGTRVARGARALADERRVKDLIVFDDPAGNRLEIFHGAQTATEAFKPGRNISGFRTGPLGMGHVVMHFERIAK